MRTKILLILILFVATMFFLSEKITAATSAVGQACNPSSNVKQCDSETVCDSATKKCIIPESSLGKSCDPSSNVRQCDNNTICDSATKKCILPSSDTSSDKKTSGISFEVNKDLLNSLNPLSSSDKFEKLSTPAGIINQFLKYAFPLAGMILFLMLVFGGFQMLIGASNSKSTEEAKQRITSAILGFLLLFAAYWIVQLVQIIFGIRILS